MQAADDFSIATPADWKPGDEVIVPPAGSCGVAKDRMEGKGEMKCYDCFFCTKRISKEDIEKQYKRNRQSRNSFSRLILKIFALVNERIGPFLKGWPGYCLNSGFDRLAVRAVDPENLMV